MAKKIPQRKCIACRRITEKTSMLRIVRTPEGTYKADKTGKADGRGCYVCYSAGCFQKVIKTRALDRSFRSKVTYGVYEAIKEELIRLDG